MPASSRRRLSSALASLLGAPRILQSLAKDRVFALPAALRARRRGRPTIRAAACLLTGGIALGIIALGNLNLIAAVVSMFFVVTYGLLNYATYYEARGKSPSFRPDLALVRSAHQPGRRHRRAWRHAGDRPGRRPGRHRHRVRHLSSISSAARSPARWADGQRSYHLQIVREHLLQANSRAEHPRDWRPQILAFSGDDIRRDRLLTFASWIEGHSGLTTVVRIIEGKGRRIRRKRDEAEEEMAESLKEAASRLFRW